MDEHTSHELAYKKGYEQGKQDAMKWIPVTERLPEEDNFLVATSDGLVGESFMNEGDFFWQESACEYFEDWRPITDRVTHWMPLPEPPKGE